MQRPAHPYLSGRFAAIAHRGGWVDPADAPRENTAYAFGRAVALGYRYLETDVWASADGEVVAFHDQRLDRVSDGSGPLGAQRWADLARVRVGGVDPLPRLADLLEEFGSAWFNVDLKDPAAVAPLACLAGRPGVAERLCVGSFSDARLAEFRRLAPGVATSASPRAVALATHGFGVRRLVRDPGIALQLPVRDARSPLRLVRADVVRLAHATGRVVHVWTVNDEAEMHRLIDLGVDGLVSDDLVTLKRVLLDRGLWEGEG